MSSELWALVDIETNGLHPDEHCILEVAMILVNAETLSVEHEMSILVAGPHVDVDALESEADAVVRKMHADNGLWRDLRQQAYAEHPRAVSSFVDVLVVPSVVELDDVLCTMATDYGFEERSMILCGSSLHGVDVPFLRSELRRFPRFFHYRTLDIRALKLAYNAWLPNAPQPAPSASRHRAHSDAVHVLETLRWFRDRMRWSGGREG